MAETFRLDYVICVVIRSIVFTVERFPRLCKGHPIRCDEGTKEEYRYSSTP